MTPSGRLLAFVPSALQQPSEPRARGAPGPGEPRPAVAGAQVGWMGGVGWLRRGQLVVSYRR